MAVPNHWENPIINQEDPRIKALNGKALQFLEKYGIDKELLSRYPITVMLPDGNTSWTEGLIFVGHNNISIKSVKKCKADKTGLLFRPRGVILTFNTDQDGVEGVDERKIFIGQQQPTIHPDEPFPHIPIGVELIRNEGDSIEGQLDYSVLSDQAYSLITDKKPLKTISIKGFLIHVSDRFSQEAQENLVKKGNSGYFGSQLFVLTEASPLRK